MINIFCWSGKGAEVSLFTLDDTGDTITTGVIASLTGDGLTTGTLLDLSADTAITDGIILNVVSSSTSLDGAAGTGSLANLEWNPGSATTMTGDLMAIDVNGNATVSGNLLGVYDNGSDVFTISQSKITSAVPHEFTAAGDASFAYDIVLSNQTASKLESYGPLTIEAGESFENNNLTLKAYGTGDVVVDGSGLSLETGENLTLDSNDSGDSYIEHNNASNYLSVFTDGSEIVRFNSDLSVDGNTTFDINQFDIAETYPTFDQEIGPGDLVTVDNSYEGEDIAALVKRTELSNDERVLGIVSTSPGFTMGAGSFGTDFCSEVNQDGVDSALDEYRATLERIEAEANEIVANTDELDEEGLLSLEQEKKIIQASIDEKVDAKRDVAEACLASNQTLVALAGRVPAKVTLTKGSIQTGDQIAASSLIGVGEKAVDAGLVVGTALEGFSVEECDEEDNSCEWIEDANGDLVPTKKILVFVNVMWYPGAQNNSLVLGVQDDVSNIPDDITLNGDLLVRSDLSVLGETLLADARVTGIASIGLLELENQSINSLAGTLYLQDDYAAGNIDAFNGKIVMTTQGDIKSVGEVTAKKYNVDTSDVAGASAGSITIYPGQTSVIVDTTALTNDSLIFVTPDMPVAIGSRKIGDNQFEVQLSQPATSELKVNWWIIN